MVQSGERTEVKGDEVWMGTCGRFIWTGRCIFVKLPETEYSVINHSLVYLRMCLLHGHFSRAVSAQVYLCCHGWRYNNYLGVYGSVILRLLPSPYTSFLTSWQGRRFWQFSFHPAWSFTSPSDSCLSSVNLSLPWLKNCGCNSKLISTHGTSSPSKHSRIHVAASFQAREGKEPEIQLTRNSHARYSHLPLDVGSFEWLLM